MRTLLTITILLLCVTSAMAFNPETEPIIIKGNNLTESMTQKVAVDMMNIFTDPKGIWLMQGDGLTLNDAFSTAHSGTLTGGITFPTDRTAKGFGHSLLFNGTTDYIDLGDSDDFSFGNGTTDEAFTICALVNVVEGSVTRVIVSRWDSTTGSEQQEWLIQLRDDETVKLFIKDLSSGASPIITSGISLSEGYNFLVFTYDGSGGADADDGLNIYINGVIDSSQVRTPAASYVSMENTTSSLQIGSSISSAGAQSNFYNSNIAFVTLEKSELTAAQVYQLWKTVQGVYGL